MRPSSLLSLFLAFLLASSGWLGNLALLRAGVQVARLGTGWQAGSPGACTCGCGATAEAACCCAPAVPARGNSESPWFRPTDCGQTDWTPLAGESVKHFPPTRPSPPGLASAEWLTVRGPLLPRTALAIPDTPPPILPG